ncbi:MAG: SGNH/GDSL hydrolase family protein [Patulibacter sp.]|nr:SGNH/GDSL hydrolase family protein [Patulibacter sp.]
MSRITRRLAAAVSISAAALAVALPSAAQAVDYTALGDSFSSGVGAGSYDLSSSCSRTSNAYPAKVAAATGFSLSFTACSGATTTDVIANQLGPLDSSTDYVTVTAGGNDAGFTSLIANCTILNCVSSVNAKITWTTTTLPGLLNNLYSQIAAEAPNATVIVLGYPRLFNGTTCSSAFGISTSEMAAANDLVDAFDTVTAARAAAYGFTYKSAVSQFTGHALCSSSPWLNGLSWTLSNSYHPNAAGQSSGYTPLVRSITG